MKKMLTVALVMLLLMSINAFASETRVKTMGENNTILLDDANIWEFPSRINEYPNLAVGDFAYDENGYTGDYDGFGGFGIHWKFGSDNDWVLATYISTLGPYTSRRVLGGDYPLLNTDLLPTSFSSLNNMDNRGIDFIFGYKMDQMSLALAFSMYSASETYEYETSEEEKSFSYFDVSLGLTEETNQLDVAINLGVGTFTDKDSDGAEISEPDGFMDFGVNGRIFFQSFDKVTLVPHAGLNFSNRGIKNNVTSQSVSMAYLDLDLGCGLNFTPATNVLAVLDFGFALDVMNVERKYLDPDNNTDISEANVFIPYVKMGVDADVFKWMDIRFGATHTNKGWAVDDGNDNTLSRGYTENDTYLGFGFHWGRLHVDTYTDPELFLEGLNFISGANHDMNFQISAIYEMM